MKKNVEEKVLKVLEKYPVTRKDDWFLIYAVNLEYNADIKNMSYADVMRYHKELGLPSYKSITRARRKIMETRQDLIDWKTAVIRAEEKEEYKEYSRK